MEALMGGYKRARWANSVRFNALAALDAIAEQLNDKGKQAIAIAREDLLTHTDSAWWIDHCNEFQTPEAIYNTLSDTAQAAITALKQ